MNGVRRSRGGSRVRGRVQGRVHRNLREGSVTGNTPLVDILGIGPYLEGRLRTALNRSNELTVGDLWTATRRRTGAGLMRLVLRALQNARANQCVDGYHVGDVNEVGYVSIATLINHRRPGTMPHAPPRSPSARACGCRALDDCEVDVACRVSDDRRACVPRSAHATGFVGVVPNTNQREDAREGEDARVRRAARVRTGRAGPARDADSDADVAAGHARTLGYSRRGHRLWRRPSPRVRQPR